ncbi:MAG: ParB/RepB/Spo0J family partition protein [Clostridia bacterium]|nr:ParB/RepB/Spo0J family partition protein [Clostridia bacterium]
MKQKRPIAGQILLVEQENIARNPNQPRMHFDYDELSSLAESIRHNGLLQPLTVRPADDGTFELIAGERRLIAARMVGLARIPCIVMNVDDEKSAVFSLIENIQRQNIGFFEEAAAIERLINVFGLSREDISKKLGKAPSTIANKLRLLSLNSSAREKIIKSGLTERHARALLRLEDDKQQARALSIMADKHLTVAESEQLISRMLGRKPINRKMPLQSVKDVRLFVNTLNHAVDTIRKAGIDADSVKSETEEYIEYVVRIPKPAGVTPVLKAKAQAVST